MVCCSMASCIAAVSLSSILSSSSIAAKPLSASTSAPASRVHLPSPKSSLTAAAVSPAALDPLPKAKTPRGEISVMYFKSWDLAVPGSPTISMWISPLMVVPSLMTLRTPPNIWRTSVVFTISMPYIVGAMDVARTSIILGVRDSSTIFSSSSVEMLISSSSFDFL